MKKRIPIMGIILLLLLSNISFPTSSTVENQSNTIYVDDNGTADYTTIQDAIDNASEGDTIFVYNGIYYGRIKINKTIVLQGEDKNLTLLDGRKSNVIDLKSDNIQISGFTIRNASTGIHTKHSSYSIISDNIIIDCNLGIGRAYDGPSSTHNIITCNYFKDCFAAIGSDDLWYYNINNNRFFSNNHGIHFKANYYYGSYHNKICNNIFEKNNKGIYFDYWYMFLTSDYNNISYNTFTKNEIGILIKNDHRYNTISRNNFIKNIIGVTFFYGIGETTLISQNYWDRQIFTPKFIICFSGIFFFRFTFDEEPVRDPYNIQYRGP